MEEAGTNSSSLPPFSLSNDGVTIMSKDAPDYEQVKGEFEALFEMDDPSFEEANYKQFVTMAMTLNDPESIRKACGRYCTLYGYEDSVVLAWLYRELKTYSATGDKSILEYMYENIFRKSLSEKYCEYRISKCALIIFKFLLFFINLIK